MSPTQAQAWIQDRFGSAVHDKLRKFVELLVAESVVQNLIAASTLDTVWSRHIADSAQLLLLAEHERSGVWLDVGSGAGLPGVVVACVWDGPVILVEPRRTRAEFLRQCVELLRLPDVTIMQSRIEALTLDRGPSIISARAVAPLERLLSLTWHLATHSTTWLLPKGRSAHEELANLGGRWHASFHVEQSITDADSHILVVKDPDRMTRGKC